jgi:hypothetical protein
MASTNQCIGSHYDELKHRVFFFNYNSAGYHGIYVYDVKTNAITPLLISYIDSQEDIFGFDPKYPIPSVNILYRTEEDGDILYWTDRNNRPMKLNIKETTVSGKTYGTNWKKEYLTVARKMPLLSAQCQYSDDSSRNINTLKNKVYQFRYQWVYNDDTKSCWSPWSKLFAPANVDMLSNEINPTKNNVIYVDMPSVGGDIKEVRIGARHSIVDTFSDTFLVDSLTTAEFNALTTTTSGLKRYNFFNTEAYPFIDKSEDSFLFDYVPVKANSQELLNGNVLIYGGITEGVTFDVPFTNNEISLPYVELVANAGGGSSTDKLDTTVGDTQPSSPPYSTGSYFIYLTGTPDIGDVINLNIIMYDTGGQIHYGQASISYTVQAGSTSLSAIQSGLVAAINANTTVQAFRITAAPQSSPLAVKLTGTTYTSNGTQNTKVLTVGDSVVWANPPSNGTTTEVNTAIYKHKSTYRFGLVYFDEFGVTNGVVTASNMNVNTPELTSANIGATSITIPAINFSLTHTPPSWAKYFSFVRTNNLSISDFKNIKTTTAFLGGTEYGYLDITGYNNNTSGWPVYEFKKGDRVRVLGVYNGVTTVRDYPVLDLLTKKPGTSDVGHFIKVPYDNSTDSTANWLMSQWGGVGYTEFVIDVYSPSINADPDSDLQLFYEFGETYEIYTDANGNRSHKGATQNQVRGTGAQPALYTFKRGDAYSRQRVNYMWIVDQSVSDNYSSKVIGNGRAFIKDQYAKQIYYPTTVRYSLEYQPNTNINDTNRFLSGNLDEYDREKGAIQRLKTRGRQIRVFQSRACGVAPILQNMLQTADGNTVVSQSTEILNKIQYYQGDYGIGEQYCSLASSAQADYFVDPVLGAQIRLSNDGITSLTETYKAHFFLTDKISKYQKTNYADKFANGGYAKILGIYDVFEEEYVACFQGSADGLTDYTIAFSETRNAYSSFYDYYPEWIESAGNLLITWKNGELWTHNNTSAYANFYGTQYNPSIKLVFNENQNIKKHYTTITTLGNTTWIAATNGDINTNMNQQSRLIQADFKVKDDKAHASFKRDVNSTGGLYNGNVLKGSWLELNLKPVNPQSLVDLYYVELGIQQPLNNR